MGSEYHANRAHGVSKDRAYDPIYCFSPSWIEVWLEAQSRVAYRTGNMLKGQTATPKENDDDDDGVYGKLVASLELWITWISSLIP